MFNVKNGMRVPMERHESVIMEHRQIQKKGPTMVNLLRSEMFPSFPPLELLDLTKNICFNHLCLVRSSSSVGYMRPNGSNLLGSRRTECQNTRN